MSSIDVVLYGIDGDTYAAGPVADVLAVSALDELEGTGGGSVTIAADSPTLTSEALIGDRKVVGIRVDGVVRQKFIIAKRRDVVVGEGAESRRAIEISGPGLLHWLRDSIVYQESPTPFARSVRHFGFGSRRTQYFDPSDWGFATNLRRRGGADLNDPGNPWRNRPLNWPPMSPEASWIWTAPGSDVNAPPGLAYFRRGFVAPTGGGRYRLYFACDDQAAVHVDGEALASTPPTPDSFGLTWQTEFAVPAGLHVLGFACRNTGGPAGLLAVLVQLGEDDDGNETMTRVIHTGDNSWRVKGYPTDEPGFTPGGILLTLLGEASRRGVDATRYGFGFSNTTDSGGVAWRTLPWKVAVGTDLLRVAEELRNLGLDLAFDPVLMQVKAWASRGSSTGVVIDAGSHIEDASEQIESQLVNALLINTGEQWAGAADAASIGAVGRIEDYLDLSRYTPKQALEIVTALFERAKIPVEAVEIQFVPGPSRQPWVDFGPGDTVTVQTPKARRTRKVVGIGVAMDGEQGEPIWTVEFDSVKRDILDRLEQIINQAGLAEGSAPLAQNPGGPGSGGGTPGGGGSDPGWGGGAPGGDYPDWGEWPGGGDEGGWPTDGGWDYSNPDEFGNPTWNPDLGFDPDGFLGDGAPGSGLPGSGLPATPVITPPGPTDGTPGGGGEGPWLPPTDPGGGTGLPGVPNSGGVGVGQVAASVATNMVDVWEDYGSVELALLTDAPTLTDGVWATDLSGIELDGDGYERATLLMSSVSAATGNGPVTRTNSTVILFAPNTGTGDWAGFTHLAVVASDDTVLSVVPLASPVAVGTSESLLINPGDLSFTVDSA